MYENVKIKIKKTFKLVVNVVLKLLYEKEASEKNKESQRANLDIHTHTYVIEKYVPKASFTILRKIKSKVFKFQTI